MVALEECHNRRSLTRQQCPGHLFWIGTFDLRLGSFGNFTLEDCCNAGSDRTPLTYGTERLEAMFRDTCEFRRAYNRAVERNL